MLATPSRAVVLAVRVPLDTVDPKCRLTAFDESYDCRRVRVQTGPVGRAPTGLVVLTTGG